MKKKIIVVMASLFCMWIIVGVAARRNILSLIATGEERNIIKCEDFVFGVQLNVGKDLLIGEVTWLDENENIEFRKCISNAILGGCISSDSYFLNDKDFVSGSLYLIPCWVHELGIKRILRPLLHEIDMFYWPTKNFLYLSENIEELGYDFCQGLSISNVCPNILKIEFERLIENGREKEL